MLGTEHGPLRVLTSQGPGACWSCYQIQMQILTLSVSPGWMQWESLAGSV